MRSHLARWLIAPIAFGLATAGLLLVAAQVVRADMAPIPAQAGTNFGTTGSTDIRMVSETVSLVVTDMVITNEAGFVYTQTGAAVTADFLLNNPEAGSQSLQVGFPLEVPAQAVQAGGQFARLRGLRAFVGGIEADTTLTTVGQDTWSAWQMSFAPGETQVRVTYDMPATTDACNAELGYVLHTGAAWAGTIGQADLIVRYPYAAEATFVGRHGIYLGDSTAGYRVEGNDLRWHYENLEPTAANDLAVTFVAPECWLPVAAARTALNQHATADNYWHLADAYAVIVFPHHGFDSPLLAQVAEAQYQKALALDPQNPQINAAYAEYLVAQVGGLLPASRQPDKIRQCLRALPLAPRDDQLLYACVPVINTLIGDPNVSAEEQATVAAVLNVAPLPTFPSNATATPANPTATPSIVASALPSASATPLATGTRPPEPSPTISPKPPATSTTVTVAQATGVVTPLPVPQTQPGPGNSWLVPVIGLAILVGLAGGVFHWRRRTQGQSNT